MDLEQLEYFRVAASSEHLSRAARKLGVSQSALSRSIARTEEHFGARLFDRVGRGISLNQGGKLLLARLDRVFTEVAASKHELTLINTEDERTTVLGLCSTFSSDFIARTVGRFAREHPDIAVSSVRGTLEALVQQLREGEIDLLLSGSAIAEREIAQQCLAVEEYVALVPHKHRLARRHGVGLKDLAMESFASLKAGYGLREDLEHFAATAGFEPHVVFEAEDLSTTIAFVERGYGVALVPGGAYEQRGRAVPVRVLGPKCTRSIALYWIADGYLNAATKQLRTTIADDFSTADSIAQ